MHSDDAPRSPADLLIAQASYENESAKLYLSLGRFLHQFSILENAMFICLCAVTSVTQEVGRALFSGLRVEAAKDKILLTLEATTRSDTKDKLKPYFIRIGYIQKVRNKILHYGAAFDYKTNSFLVSNERDCLPGKTVKFPVDVQMLDNLTCDTTKAYLGVLSEIVIKPTREGTALFQRYLESDWKYKP